MEELSGPDTKVQRLITGFRCEVPGCREQAVWYVSAGTDSFHWCGKDTVTCMEEKEFWERKIKRAEILAGTTV